MSDLLARVLDAHGGRHNWATVTGITAHMELGGPFWEMRGWPNIYEDQTVSLDVRRQHITFTPFTGPGLSSVLDVGPERVAIVAADGRVTDERDEPRRSFPLPFDPFTTRWDALQVAYFTSAAVWNYLTEPFGLSDPGVEVEEIEPWHEDGETWRRLAVTFPPSNANHNRTQVFYYGYDFMQRRMDYSPDVTGNPPICHYTDRYRSFDGFVFPTRRRVYLHDPKGIANQDLALITIDVDSVKAEVGS